MTERSGSHIGRLQPAHRCRHLFGLLLFLAMCSIPLRGQTSAEPVEQLADTARSDTLIFIDSAQPRFRVGVFGGPSFANAVMRSFPLDPEITPGYSFGIRTELEFAAPLYFLLEAELIHRPLHTTVSGLASEVTYNFQFSYLQFPLLFQTHFHIGDGPVLTPGIGVVPSVAISRRQAISNGIRDTVIAVDSGIQAFDFGLELRLGSEWSLGERSAVTLDLRYLFGLQNLLILASREDPRAWHARTLGLSFGWMYQLQRPIYRE